jgi:uncharacterized protein
MSNGLTVYPFDAQRFIGTISEVGPTFVKANLPNATLSEGQWHHGNRIGVGEVGEFVVVEGGEVGIVGRIVNVRLPERERLAVEAELGTERRAHPVGTIQLLTTINLAEATVVPGIPVFPRLGARLYSLHPETMKLLAEASGQVTTTRMALDLGFLPSAGNTQVRITPERLFGRHCAVLGTTGGGKSWTVARLVEQSAAFGAKVILLDATGEFHRLDCGVRHLHVGEDTTATGSGSTEVVLPHTELTEADLLALFKPSGQTQAPKLRMAMKSLKLAKLAVTLGTGGIIVKANQAKKPFDDAYRKNAAAVESPKADFDIRKLVQQINEECVWSTARSDPSRWGDYNDNERSYCVTLVTRVEEIIQSPELACVFKPAGKTSLLQQLAAFYADKTERVLRISLKSIPFSHNAREIVANAIGRYLLGEARGSKFKAQPLLVFLDEAHQFLDKSLGDENTKYALDSFDLIAKEGRKFCLNICIATQRPRDVPEGVLSQMGTLIVHRLINDKDREIVERASGEIDRSAADFLPALAPGQAVIIGADFPMPLTVQIHPPNKTPDSQGPDFQACWKV